MRTVIITLLVCGVGFAQGPVPGSGGGSGNVSGVTSVAGDCGLAGGTVTTTGAFSVTGPCYAAGGGTAQAQTATYTVAGTMSLVDNLTLCWKPTAANTTSGPTFAPNSLTAHTIVKAGGTALVANDLTTTAIACAVYDTTGTQWELQNPQTAPASGVAVQVNGSATGLGTTANFNGTTPAAGSGNQNGTYQVSGTSISVEMPQPQYLGAVNAIGAAGSAQTVACPVNGVLSMTLSANLTITITQPSGTTCLVRMELTQAAGGGDTVTITGAKWPGGIAAVMTATANAVDIWSCLLDGTNTYCTVGQAFQ